jgi:CDP-diacylglycerol--glycerol-3-phosphate 3-phosphatidyltransferase
MCIAWNGHLKIYVLCLCFSLVTDVLDGFLARWLKQTTEFGAKLDSRADFATVLSLPICVWWLRPDVVRDEAPYVCVALAGYLVPVAAGLLKYKRLTSYHTWAGKVAAVILGPGVVLLLATELNRAFQFVAVVAFLAGMEELAITSLLREWRANVPSLWHALQMNRRTKE